jgi:acetylornithine deacetylase/succinyl-diaminopimelate desuccinylase-like protein
MTEQRDAALDWIDAHLDASVDKLFELVRIPSISNDPAYAGACRLAAQWLADRVRDFGFIPELVETAGHPVMLARHVTPGDPDRPHVLFYGHYDVQPPDAAEKWATSPFAPLRRTDEDGEERLFGRGMADDKGLLYTFLAACEALHAVGGALPLDVTIVLEGEEEAGSPSFPGFLDRHGGTLGAQVVLVSDTDMWDRGTPAITTRLKGLFHDRVIIRGPNRDLHSGMYGGVASNPARVLSQLIASLYDGDNRVTIPHFYDEVSRPPDQVLAGWRGLGVTAATVLSEIGLTEPVLETGQSVVEQLWARPVIDVNGLTSGNQNAAARSVLPGEASAHLSFRLVPDQDPDVIRARFRAHVRAFVPKDCAVIHVGDDAGRPYAIDESDPFIRITMAAVRYEWGVTPVLKGNGGTNPVMRWMKDRLGLDSVMLGFGLSDDAIHAPNEKLDLRCFHKGMRSWVHVLCAIAREGRAPAGG